MKGYYVKVTQQVLDYLEDVKSGKFEGWRYTGDTQLTLNESFRVDGVSEDRQRLLLSNSRDYRFTFPARLFPEFDIEAYVEEARKEQMERDREEQRKKFIESHDWDSLRIDIAVKMLQSLASNHALLMHEVGTSEEIAEQQIAARRCVYTALWYADELIRQLIYGKK